MLRSFLGSKTRHRKFNYEPRYYDPRREQRIKERMRISSVVRRGKGGNVLIYIVALSAILWILVKINA
jgi:hypothetical protein